MRVAPMSPGPLAKIYLVVVVVAIALGLVVLSRGDEDGISKAEFIRAGNAICRATIQTLTEEGRETFSEAELKGTNVAGVPFVLGTYVPEFRAEVRRLRALGAPSGDEARVEAILLAIEGMIGEAKREPDRIVHQVTNRYARPQELAMSYGLDECPTTRYTLW
jgi:hypothetical protein